MIPDWPRSILRARCKPRASGDDPTDHVEMYTGDGVNPARAGMIQLEDLLTPQVWRKPRASGDDPERKSVLDAYKK